MPRERLHRAFHPRARRLRLLHQSHQPGDGAVRSRRRHPHLQRTALVHRAAVHLVARRFGHRDALAGEGRLVHRGGPFDDDAVEGYLISRLDQDNLADRDVLDGNLLLRGREPPRLLRPQREHRTHGRRCPAHGAILEPLAHAKQRHHRGSLAKVLQRARPRHRHRHQRVDVHDAVAERAERLARDGGYTHHHRTQRHPSKVLEVTPDVVQQGHGQEHARHQDRRRGRGPGPAAPAQVGGVRAVCVGRVAPGRCEGRLQPRRVEGVDDGVRGRSLGGVLHQHGLRRDDDLHPSNARFLVQDGVDQRHLAGAAYALNLEPGVRRRLCTSQVLRIHSEHDRLGGRHVDLGPRGGVVPVVWMSFSNQRHVLGPVGSSRPFPRHVHRAVVHDTRSAAVVVVHVVARALALIGAIIPAVLLAPGDYVDEPVANHKVDVVAVGYGVHALPEQVRPGLLRVGRDLHRLQLFRGQLVERVGAVAPVRGHGDGPPGPVLGPDHQLTLDEVRVRGRRTAGDHARTLRGCREIVQIIVIPHRLRGRPGLGQVVQVVVVGNRVRSHPRVFMRVQANDRGVQAQALVLARPRLVARGAVATATIVRRGHRCSPGARLRSRVSVSSPL